MKNILIFILLLSFNTFSQDQILFNEDFEDGLTGWTIMNLADSTAPTLWRSTNQRFFNGNFSAAWNDSTTNTYSHNRYEAIESPGIVIPYNTRVFLKFKAFIHLTLNGTYTNDYFFIKYTTNNGITWNNFLPYAYSGQQLNWRSFPEDFGPTAYDELTYYAGKTMKFRIIVHSDSLNSNGLGVFLDDFIVYSRACEVADTNEPNNNTATATLVQLGTNFTSSLCPQNDEDVYKFTVNQGEQINIATQHSMPWTYLYLLNENGFTLKYAYNEMNYTANYTGTYYIRVTGSYNYSANYSIYFNNKPEPDIISVTDIPDDQGLKVRVKWQSSFYDPQNTNGKIKEYQLWRKLNDSSSTGNWEFIETIPALSGRPFTNYSYVALTLADNELTTFRVAAIPNVENIPIAWGMEGSGSSIDNLSPNFNNVNAVLTNNGIKLSWNNSNSDLSRVEIYKGVHELFPPLQEYKIADVNVDVKNFIDNNLLSGYQYYYIITAKDNSNNIFYSQTISTGTLTLISDDRIIPDEFLLYQNYPNPFNPLTVIEFSLPEVSRISLKIFNALGSEVKELANGVYNPGLHSLEFDASELPSGVYFYRLSNGEYKQTKKMVLLK